MLNQKKIVIPTEARRNGEIYLEINLASLSFRVLDCVAPDNYRFRLK